MSGITGIAMGMTRTTVAMTGMIGVGGMEISTRTEVTHGKTRGTQTEKDTICGKITVTWDRMFKSQCNPHRFKIYRVNIRLLLSGNRTGVFRNKFS